MPFRSKAQQRWMFATHPRMAKEWAEHTEDFSKLPERVGSKKKKKKKKRNPAVAPAEKVAGSSPEVFSRVLQKVAEETRRKKYPALVACRHVSITITATRPKRKNAPDDNGKKKDSSEPKANAKSVADILPDQFPSDFKKLIRRLFS